MKGGLQREMSNVNVMIFADNIMMRGRDSEDSGGYGQDREKEWVITKE